jgi:superfamily II DNA or RNA helicase
VLAVAAETEEPGAFDLSYLEDTVGARSLERGRAYARRGRVLNTRWYADDAVLMGSVVGNGQLYRTEAQFVAEDDGSFTFHEGECSCPIGYDCKHVAALVIATADAAVPGADAARPPRAPDWEQPLQALLATSQRAAGTPLAVELTIAYNGLGGAGGAPRLRARLMRPGARGGWVNGSLSWHGLDSWHVHNATHRPDHLALARELRALHQAGDPRSAYHYGYGTDKTLDLSDCDSAQLWPLLVEAQRLGLPLIHAAPALGALPPVGDGAVAIDVTDAGGGSLLVCPRLELAGEVTGDVAPLLFLGPSGHGVICVDDPAGDDPRAWRLRLVRLTTPAPAPLQRLLLAGETLTIPAADVPRFAEHLCPSLRRMATIVSSDGSFTPPEVSPPSLVLRTRYGDGHTTTVSWEWAYAVGGSLRHEPLRADPAWPGFRDFAAERALLSGADLAASGLQRLGLLDSAGRPAGDGPVALTGMDGMRFTTEVLPALGEHGQIAVAVEGSAPDYRDVTETLEVGISTSDLPDDRDWFGLGVTISVEGRELPFADVFVALAAGDSHVLLDDGAHFSLAEPRLQSLRRLIEEARDLNDGDPASLRISRYQTGLWTELAALGVVTRQADAWKRQVRALLDLDTLSHHEPPGSLVAQLRPYQREGFAWLAALRELELGGILADDMGLGKTLQTLALICHTRESNPEGGPHLVVAPTSVVPNWVAEAARFAPGLRVAAMTDTLAKAGRCIDDVAAHDVVVTTYTLLRLDAERYQSVAWAGVVLDEAQYVKNHQSKTYKCVRELPAPFKLALTGTPMENNLMELWSLLSIVAPGLFPDPRRFAEHYARPIERGRDTERLDRLRRRMRPLVKRRTKELVAADLPAKQQQTLVVDLSPRHRKLYDTHLQRERQKILGLLGDFDRHRFTILRSITLLRQMSLHPGLVDESAQAVPCTKLAALSEQLSDVIGGGHRALVFSQFTGFLARVRDQLDRDGIAYCYLDGRTRRRERVVEAFKTGDAPVFLISLKAGGFGLNLTEADYCFLLDPWWNPATERQAVDRTHRIGQTRSVMVYRMIARDTIEEKVAALAERKAALFDGVMDDGDLFSGGVTADDIRGLLA